MEEDTFPGTGRGALLQRRPCMGGNSNLLMLHGLAACVGHHGSGDRGWSSCRDPRLSLLGSMVSLKKGRHIQGPTGLGSLGL